MASDAEQLVEAHRQLAELDLREGCFDEAGRHLEIAAKLAERTLAASEASHCWLAYADYLANRLLVRKAREAVASACRFAEKSENMALISEAIGYAGLVAAMCGRASEASDLVERALRIALDQGVARADRARLSSPRQFVRLLRGLCRRNCCASRGDPLLSPGGREGWRTLLPELSRGRLLPHRRMEGCLPDGQRRFARPKGSSRLPGPRAHRACAISCVPW